MDLLKRFAVPLAAAMAAAAVPSTAFAQATGNGLIAEYYNTNNFTGAVALTQANQGPINFAYGNNAPAAGVNADNFSVRWRGELEAPSTETYTFFTTQDDQCRLYVNGTLILTNTAVNVEQSATFNLVAGQRYAIMIEFIEFGGGAGVAVRWSSPVTTAKDFIPLNRLYSPAALPAAPTFSPDGGVLPLSSVSMTAPAAGTAVFYTLDGSDPGLSVPGPSALPFTAPISLAQTYLRIRARAYGPLGTPSNLATSAVFSALLDPITLPAATVPGVYARYYHLNNPQVLPAFEPLFPQRRSVLANFGIGLTPARDRNDQFGFKLTGFVNIPAEGVWTFTSGSDDGSKLYLHAHEVVSNDGLHGAPGPSPTGSVALKAGWHPITVTQFENGGGEGLGVQWQGPGVPAAVPIPDANLATEPAAAVPAAVPAGATFAASQLVTLNAATPGSVIHYTLDGSPPDPRATGAVGATGLSFTVTSTTRVRALAVVPGLLPSDVLDVTFTKTVPPGPKYASLTAAGVATQAVVEFDRPVALASAGNPANYGINNGATVSAAVPLTKAGALRAYWKFDEAAGPAADSSGNGNAGAYVGGPTPDAVNFATLPFGNGSSLAFDGVDDLVQVPNSASLDLADKNFTISLWIRPSTTGTAQALINHHNFPTAERGWRVDINSANGGGLAAGNVWVRLRDGTDTAEASLGAGLTAGAWQHLAIRVERARNRFTVMRNGGAALVNDFTTNVRRRIDMNPRPLQIGAIQNAAGAANERFFSGNLDDVR
ncbi:MAG TPA: PA14 domain-containing protein, partial [Planctomycetota bacterium]